jgi:hypothetical protein
MGWQWGTRGQKGWWWAQVPCFENILKVGNCIHLGDYCGRCHTCKGSGDNLKAMDDLILCEQCMDREVGMVEFNRIGDNLTLGVHIDQFEVAV